MKSILSFLMMIPVRIVTYFRSRWREDKVGMIVAMTLGFLTSFWLGHH